MKRSFLVELKSFYEELKNQRPPAVYHQQDLKLDYLSRELKIEEELFRLTQKQYDVVMHFHEIEEQVIKLDQLF
jgi:DNA-binding response OmpR family regulator